MDRSLITSVALCALFGVVFCINKDDIIGKVGFGRSIVTTTVKFHGVVPLVGSSSACCEKCVSNKMPDTELYMFYDASQMCICQSPREGANVKTEQAPNGTYVGVCERVDCSLTDWSSWSDCRVSCGGGLEYRRREVTTPASHGGEPCGQLLETRPCNTQACPEPEALALTTPGKKCENGDQSGIACCPQFTTGDNDGLGGKETFVQENELVDGDCQKTCQDEEKFPNSVGMTQHISEKYSNGKPKCWCESGEPILNMNAQNYHTCLF